jgi:hypothetical protein
MMRQVLLADPRLVLDTFFQELNLFIRQPGISVLGDSFLPEVEEVFLMNTRNMDNIRSTWKTALQPNCWHISSGTLSQLPSILVLLKDRDGLIAIDGLENCRVALVSCK